LADKNPLITFFSIKHLTPDFGGQFTPVWSGQGHWLFYSTSQRVSIGIVAVTRGPITDLTLIEYWA
jgi:hypothetical protein